jgi:extradiol dioxygenase family protein
MALTPFHIAFPVDDLAAARNFYGEILGCPEGRSSEQWIDFDLFGHRVRPPPTTIRWTATRCRCPTSAW